MNETSIQDWEGRTIDSKFALLAWVGGSRGHAEFLTVRPTMEKAVIHLILAADQEAETYLTQWQAAKSLSHPHLMPVFDFGQCVMDDVSLVYLVTQHPAESLSQKIANKALNTDEVTSFMIPLLDLLSFLHKQKSIHGHVNSSNILAVSDQWKLSCEEFFVCGGITKRVKRPGDYDAPEALNGELTPAIDVWSLGITLVEAMTQRLPLWNWTARGGPVVPESLPEPFFEIAQNCLRLDANRRCTIESMRTLLAPAHSLPVSSIPVSAPPVSANQEAERSAPTHVAEPADVRAGLPEATVEPVPAQHFPIEPEARIAEEEYEPRPDLAGLPPAPELFTDIKEANLSGFPVLPFLIGVVVLLGFAAVLMLRGRTTPPSPNTSQARQSITQTAKPELTPPTPQPAASQSTPPVNPTSPPPQAPSQTPPIAESESSAPIAQPAPAAVSPHRDVPQHTTPVPKTPAPPESPSPRAPNAPASVAERVLPNVTPSARSSMHGPVEVFVRVSVDSTGKVAETEYVSPGPGSYFARTAARAAKSWKFNPPEHNGHPEPSSWMLHFYFSRKSTEVNATEERR